MSSFQKNETVSITVKISGDEARNNLAILEKEAKSLERAIKEIPKGSAEWAELNKQLNANKDEQKKLRTEIGLTGLTYKQLQAEVRSLNKDLANMTPETVEFVEKSKRLQEVKGRLKEVAGQMNELAKPTAWDKIKTYMTAAFAVISIQNAINWLWSFAKSAIDVAANLSDSFGGVQKTTGMTAEEVKALNAEIKKIDTRTAQADLLKIAQIGGQMGLAKHEVMGFVESIDQTYVALGDDFTGGVEEVATKMGVLAGIFKETRDLKAGDAIDQVASSINELSANGKATAPVMTDFAIRIGALGNLAPEISQTLGLGAALQEFGLTAEIASSGLKAILTTGAKESERFAKQMRLTTKEVEDLLNTKPNEFLFELAKSFEGVAPVEVTQRLYNMKVRSNEASAVMNILAQNTKRVAELQGISKDAMEESTIAMAQAANGYKGLTEEQRVYSSVGKEFNTMNTTWRADMEKASKAVIALKEDLGAFLMPVVLALITTFVGFINILKAIPEFIVENKKWIVLLVGGLVSLNTANIAAAASALYYSAVEKGRLVVTQSLTLAQGLLNAAMRANPIGMVVMGITLLITAFVSVYEKSEKFRNSVNGLWEVVKTITVMWVEFGKALLTMDFGKMADLVANGAQRIADSFSKGYNKQNEAFKKSNDDYAKLADEREENAKKTSLKQSEAEILLNQLTNDTLTSQDEKALKKRQAQKKTAKEKEADDNKKALEMVAQMQAEHDAKVAESTLQTEEVKIEEKRRKRLKEINDSLADEKTKESARAAINRTADTEIAAVREKGNKKALEILAQMEAEHDSKVATNTLDKETAKIEEKRRKRLKEIEDSLADEKTKENARLIINRTADEALELAKKAFREKQIKEQEEAAKRMLAQNNYVREQEQKAEQTLYEWKLSQARRDATQTAAIKKEYADVQLRITQERLESEKAAEQAKAVATLEDTVQLSQALEDIEERFHTASLMATFDTAEKKKQIDLDLAQTKARNLKDYSDMFGSLLKGDLDAFMTIAGQKVKGHRDAWQEKLAMDMGSYEQGANMANQAVSFLNDLAQQKATRAIAEANRERDEKVAILNNELAVTESMIKSHSDYVQALKTAEKDRLSELQAALTSDTTTEEEKRQAMLKYYSDQFQQMKEAEEQKITDLQRLANMAKTEDEKRAIEEKIRLAENESAEKIRLAEEELEAKKQAIQDIEDFSAESSANMLDEAKTASEKQLEMADQEAVLKMEVKQDLEETIAAENRKARATEAAEKKKAWEAQKKADIATALITGALAVLKALANFFPLNIILAASAAVLTGVQVAKIKNQSMPSFAHGGFVAQGGPHGSSYGAGGIALVDRGSGREVGEMEGDEAIISKEQTAANWPVIQKMFANARTPGMKNAPVAGLPAFAQGGFVSPYWQKDMYLFGAKKKKKEAEAAAAAAEAEAAKAQKEAEAYGGDVSFDGSGAPGGDASGSAQTADAQAAHEAAQKQGEEQIKTLKGILEANEANGEAIAELGNVMLSVKDSVGSVRAAVEENTGATRGVEGAVRGNHNNHLLGEIIGRISALSA